MENEVVLKERLFGRPVVISHKGLTQKDVARFCEAMGVEFYAMGCTPQESELGWADPTMIRVGTRQFPARGYSVKLDTVVNWCDAVSSVGEQVCRGGVYECRDGSLVTTVHEIAQEDGAKSLIAFYGADGQIRSMPKSLFFGVAVTGDGTFSARHSFIGRVSEDSLSAFAPALHAYGDERIVPGLAQWPLPEALWRQFVDKADTIVTFSAVVSLDELLRGADALANYVAKAFTREVELENLEFRAVGAQFDGWSERYAGKVVVQVTGTLISKDAE